MPFGQDITIRNSNMAARTITSPKFPDSGSKAEISDPFAFLGHTRKPSVSMKNPRERAASFIKILDDD